MARPSSSRRIRAWVYDHGEEPDARCSMANERTYLAWVRTALALTVGGVALEALGVPREAGLRIGASVLCLVLGALVPVLAWVSWARTERAARDGVPAPVLSPVLSPSR